MDLKRAFSQFVGLLFRAAFVATLCAALYLGWINRSERHIIPESGIGYWLGIAGVTVLVLLLIYPLRKRLPGARWMGSTAIWFRLHMAFGLLAPTLILLHCNFNPGSVNSSAALASMLLVAASGLAGRYLYGRVYRILVGRRIEASSYFEELGQQSLAGIPARAVDRLDELTRESITPRHSLFSALTARARIKGRSRRLSRKIERHVSRHKPDDAGRVLGGWLSRKRQRAALKSWLAAYNAAISKACTLAVYERLFAWWHVLHLPLFFLLILATVIHVVAVHLY